MMRLVQITDDLPFDDMMRAEARAEGYRRLDRLVVEWASLAMRFNGFVTVNAGSADAPA
jgi:hypothetical protein